MISWGKVRTRPRPEGWQQGGAVGPRSALSVRSRHTHTTRNSRRRAAVLWCIHFTRRVVSFTLCHASKIATAMAEPPSLPPPQLIASFCGMIDCTTGAGLLFALVALVALLVCDCMCRRKRGIGLCGIIALCPSRCRGEAEALLTLDSNAVSSHGPAVVEMPKWAPWRLSHHDHEYA